MKNGLLATLILLSVTAAAAGSREASFPVRPGGELVVKLETGGSIEVVAWERDEVGLWAELHGQSADEIDFRADGDAGRVEIRSAYKQGGRRHGGGVQLRLKVPARFDLMLQTGGGGIELSGVEGRIEVETGGGGVSLAGLRGTLDVVTGGGNIELTGSEAEGRLKTGGGNVHLSDVIGVVEATTQGGDVIYDNVSPAPGSPCTEVRISTMGGNIRAPEAPCGAELETMGGNIVVSRAAEYVKAKTMGGNITLEEVEGWAKASTMGGSISAVIVGGGGRRDVNLSSNGGDITLTVPEDLSMEFDITLAYTRQSKRSYEIESDFPLNVRKTEVWDYESSPPRQYIYGEGSVGGGEHRIKIETTNGDVRVLRGR